MDNDEMSETFKTWNEGELDSFLIEISTDILKFRDDSGEFLLEKIRDSAGQKGTGRDEVDDDLQESYNLDQASGQQSLPWSTACPSP